MLTAGVVGCGRIGAFTSPENKESLPPGWLPYSHVEAIKAVGWSLRLIALCDVDKEKLAQAQVAYDIGIGIWEADELIVRTKPDILGIATRTMGRTEIIRDAVECGVKGIYFEKPISTDLGDCYAALNAVDKNNVKIIYGNQRRFHDVYMRAKDLIDDGEIGDIVEIQASFGRAGLLWTHPHTVDTILYFVGSCDVEFVQARCIYIPPFSIDDRCVDADPILKFGFIQFENGIAANISCQNNVNGLNISISGTKGTMSIPANGCQLEVNNRLVDVPITMSGTQRAYAQLARAVKTNGPSPVSTKEVRTGHEILFGFVRSSMYEGRRTRLSELDERFVITGKQGDLYP